MDDPLLHLRLAGVIRLSLHGRGPRDAYLFDPHRLALPCWSLALGERKGALLVTLDRHLDLAEPAAPPPDASVGVLALDEFARRKLSVRNEDHVLAAMESGLIGDAIVIARSRPKGAVDGTSWKDRHGQVHRLLITPTVERISEDFEAATSGPSALARTLLQGARDVLLDFDLDCFTTISDAELTQVVPWPRPLIRDHVLPEGSGPFWRAVLEKCRALTFAREPYHCGGVVAGNRLFEDAAEVVFRELLGADLP